LNSLRAEERTHVRLRGRDGGLTGPREGGGIPHHREYLSIALKWKIY